MPFFDFSRDLVDRCADSLRVIEERNFSVKYCFADREGVFGIGDALVDYEPL